MATGYFACRIHKLAAEGKAQATWNRVNHRREKGKPLLFSCMQPLRIHTRHQSDKHIINKHGKAREGKKKQKQFVTCKITNKIR